MPLPLNQTTNRFSTGAAVSFASGDAAYAVPWPLNIDTSGGRPTTTDDCAAVSPFRKRRRDSLARLAIVFAIGIPFARGLVSPLWGASLVSPLWGASLVSPLWGASLA